MYKECLFTSKLNCYTGRQLHKQMVKKSSVYGFIYLLCILAEISNGQKKEEEEEKNGFDTLIPTYDFLSNLYTDPGNHLQGK